MAVHSRVWERPDAPLREWKPMGTYVLLGIIAGVYVLQLLLQFANQYGLHTYLFVVNVDWLWRPWSPFTSTLAHGSPMHILFNGMFLYFFGPNVERILGTRRFVLLFMAAGALSGILQAHLAAGYGVWAAGGDWQAALVPASDPSAFRYFTQGGDCVGACGALGASGSLMMLFGVLMVLTPRARVMLLFPPIPLPLWVLGLGFAVMDVLGAFNPGSGVGNFAHLSGMALGLAYGAWFKGDLRRRGMRLTY